MVTFVHTWKTTSAKLVMCNLSTLSLICSLLFSNIYSSIYKFITCYFWRFVRFQISLFLKKRLVVFNNILHKRHSVTQCYAPCLTFWALFGSLVLATCNRTSCAQVHELPWGHWHIGNNREGTLSVFLSTYMHYTHLTSVGFEHSVCH